MSSTLFSVAILVRDYDVAIEYFSRCLKFKLIEDTRLTPDKRWVVMQPSGAGANILLAQASTPEQAACIGNQGGGRVFLFLHCDDFDMEYQWMKQQGVEFTEEPRSEPFGKVVVFKDLYGNKWDLIQPITEDKHHAN